MSNPQSGQEQGQETTADKLAREAQERAAEQGQQADDTKGGTRNQGEGRAR